MSYCPFINNLKSVPVKQGASLPFHIKSKTIFYNNASCNTISLGFLIASTLEKKQSIGKAAVPGVS